MGKTGARMGGQGGIATLKGVRYEVRAVLYEMPRLLRGEIKSIRYQPRSSALEASQAAKQISTDDYGILDCRDRVFYCQAKHSTTISDWTIRKLIDEGVMGQFLKQFQETPEGNLCFVSNLPAQKLKNMAEHAKECISENEFVKSWNTQIKSDCECMVERLKVDISEVWKVLQKVECIHLTEDLVDRYLSDYADNHYKDGDKFVMVLKELVEKNPGRLINREKVERELEVRGLFQVSRLSPQEIRAQFQQSSGALRLYQSDIQSIHIDRKETEDLFEWVSRSKGDSELAFLLDVAGSGKSVIMKDLLVKFENEGMPVLAIKADSLGKITSESELRQALNLADSLEAMLSVASKEKTAALLIDQLDALSQTFARDQRCLDLMMRLIARAVSIENVCVVVSCREFDRKFDPKLRQMGGIEFKIEHLEREDIERVLDKIGIKWDKLTSREQDLLKNPQHLRIYADVVGEKLKRGEKIESFGTLQELYNELWNLKILNVQDYDLSSGDLQSAVYCLVDAIHTTQLLAQPVCILDGHPAALFYLQSAGVLSVEGHRVSFFHQSFFDYCYARRFVVQNRSLAESILKGDQGFFVRAQMVQTLAYLRGAQEQRYFQELQSLMNYGTLRYHLRSLLFAWFGQQRNLSKGEKTIGLACIQSDVERKLFLEGANGNVEWFDVICPHLEEMFQLRDEEIGRVVTFLISIEDERGEETFGRLKEKLGSSEFWDSQIERCVSLYKTWNCDTAKEIFLYLCRKYPNPWQSLSLAMSNLIKADVAFACKAFGILLGRSLEEWLKIDFPSKDRDLSGAGTDDGSDEWGDLDISAYAKKSMEFEKHARKLMPRQAFWIKELGAKASDGCPEVFAGIVLAWLERCLPKLTRHGESCGWLQDEIFIWAFSSARMTDAPTHIVDGFRKSLENLAKNDESRFLSFAKRMADTRHIVLHQILIRVLIQNAERYASWAYSYLLADLLRFSVSEDVCGGNISRKLVAAIFPHLTKMERKKLEKTIMDYYPEWEKRVECLSYRGSAQHDLLFNISDYLLSKAAVKRKREWQRKFPNQRPTEPRRATAAAVGSPIPPDKCKILSDQDWLKAMRHFNDSTGWGHPREHPGKGGIVELSRAFQVVVKENTERYVSLVGRFDKSVSSEYFAAFVRGFEESGTDSDRLFEVCQMVIGMRSDDDVAIQRAVCDVLEKRAKDGVPECLIEYIRNTALTSTDPDGESWREETPSGEKYNPLGHGINTVRGRAVRSYAICMRESETCDIEGLFTILEKIGTDKSSAVRACLIDILPYVLHFDRDRVVNIFEVAVCNRRELVENHVSQQFIYYAMYTHSEEMLKHIGDLAESEDNEVCEAAGRLATLASFEACEAEALLQEYMKNNGGFRKGVATVYARNVDNPKLIGQCLGGLHILCKEPNLKIKDKIATAFEYLPTPSPDIVSFIDEFVTTDFSGRSAERLVKYAIRNYHLHTEYALKIGEKISEKFYREKQAIQELWQVDDDMIDLIVAIYNHPSHANLRGRAMDLFDRVLERGSHHAHALLRSLDR